MLVAYNVLTGSTSILAFGLHVRFLFQEATAVQRAKRALKAQLELRASAARRAQQLRDEVEADGGPSQVGEEEGRGKGSESATKELEDLDERIAAASKVRLCYVVIGSDD